MEGFDPLTAREALLAIAVECAGVAPDGVARSNVHELARRGLNRTGMENFELTDQLADRLAEAHQMLRRVSHSIERGRLKGEDVIAFDIPAALALPPDLEAMVERRIGSS